METINPIMQKIADETKRPISDVKVAWNEASKRAKYLIMGNPKKYNPTTYAMGTEGRVSLVANLTRQGLGVDSDGIAPVTQSAF